MYPPGVAPNVHCVVPPGSVLPAETVTLTVVASEPSVTEITAVPAATPVIRPSAFTVATTGAEDDQGRVSGTRSKSSTTDTVFSPPIGSMNVDGVAISAVAGRVTPLRTSADSDVSLP